MRRNPLPPALALSPTADAFAGVDAGAPAQGRREPGAPARRPLAAPSRAPRGRRHLFHPQRGWVRRLERSVNHLLSARVFPAVPGIHLPYGRQLRAQLSLTEGDVEVAGLPLPFDGLRVLVVTDPHAGPFVSVRDLGEAFERLMQLAPDLVLVVGDLITARTVELTGFVDAYRRLSAPHGVFAVLGNHDYYSGEPRRVAAGIEALGFRLLHNDSFALERGGATLSLAGVDDLLMGRPDLDAALAGTRPPVVLLSHNPDLFFDAARRGVALTLSGHTHAGQIRVPGLPVIVRQSRFRLDEGRFRHRDSELIVSRGLGTVGLPLRLACPPEALLLTLRAADATG
jgi:predicted MPP superfamily phosphohydrolase